LLLALPLAGCSLQELAADSMVPVFVKSKEEFDRGRIPRYAREAAPALLATLDALALASPENPELRLLQAEMHFSFGFAFLEEEDPVWASDHYLRAQRAALAALRDVEEELAEALEDLPAERVEQRLGELGADAVPALFWWAIAGGSRINLNRGDPGLVAGLDRIDAIMEWVLQQDERFFFGGPHLYFALRNVALPPSLGGDPPEGIPHFEAVDRITRGRYLLARVFRAKFYAPNVTGAVPAGAGVDAMREAQQKAWEEFFGGLVAVLEAPDDLWPEQALANAIAKERARALLADPEAHNIIPPPGAENPYAESGQEEGDWGEEEGDWGEDEGDWED
jgi:hypothetical protein